MKVDYSEILDYDEAHWEEQRNWWESEVNLDFCSLILPFIPEGSYVIDAGCGSGAAIQLWLTKAKKVYAIDKSERALNEVRKHYPISLVIPLKGDLRELNELVLPCDVVICKAVLKHFGPEWRDILKQLASVAEKYLIVTAPTGTGENCKETVTSEFDSTELRPWYDWRIPEETFLKETENLNLKCIAVIPHNPEDPKSWVEPWYVLKKTQGGKP